MNRDHLFEGVSRIDSNLRLLREETRRHGADVYNLNELLEIVWNLNGEVRKLYVIEDDRRSRKRRARR